MRKKGVWFLYYWGVNLVQSKSVFFGVFVVLKVTSLRKSKMGWNANEKIKNVAKSSFMSFRQHFALAAAFCTESLSFPFFGIKFWRWSWNWNWNWNWNLELKLKSELKLKLKLKFLHWVFFLVWPDSRNVAGTIVSLCKFKWVYLVVFQDFWMISLIQGVPWRFLFSLPNEGL